MFVLIVDVYGESLCLLMSSVFWNIGGLGECKIDVQNRRWVRRRCDTLTLTLK